MRVSSYNVLADGYINHAWYPEVDPYLLEPLPRRARLIRFLRAMEADLICLQEVEPSLFNELQLAGIYSQKRRGKWDGCATLFRQPLHDAETLYFEDRHKGKPSGHLAQLSLIDFEGRRLGIANTHIKWDRPGTPEERQVGRQQIEQLLQATQKSPVDGWILCGDFNVEPTSPLIALLQEAGFSIASALQPTCNVNQTPQTLDYIFISPALQAEAIPLPTITGATPLPNEEQPSDHLPVSADVRWRAP